MRIVLAAFLLVQLLAQVTGAVFVLDQACEDSESGDDGSQEDCTPGCEECLCCPHPRLLPKKLVGEFAVLEGRDLVFAPWDRLIVEPEPSDIMHVPKVGSAS